MNFTREPIIETIISPKDGHKLVVRNSKGGGEEYYVDAVEVVSFGRAFFFRSMERPKPFLLPVSDYEVLEAKETRVALKNVSHERNIKIGGGRDTSHRPPQREQVQPKEVEPATAEESSGEETVLEAAIGSRMDKRRDRRRHRRRRGGDDAEWARKSPETEEQGSGAQEGAAEGGGGAEDEAKVSSPMFSSLIPPPPTLISETISRYKETLPPQEVEEEKPKPEKKEPPKEEPDSESSTLSRVSSEPNSMASTYFTSLPGSRDNFFF